MDNPLGILLTFLGMATFTLQRIRSLDAKKQKFLVTFP
jgi:hypothetical protein